MDKEVYLDHAATTPVDPKVIDAMAPYFGEIYGNPGSLHSQGREAKKAVEDSRKIVANILGTKKENIIFTAGGTQSIALALFGYARRNQKRASRPKGHIITSVIEHTAVLEACKALEYEGFDVTYISVDSNGIINKKHLVEAVRDDTLLVSVMHANNEIGTVQPIPDIGKSLHQINEARNKRGQRKILFHTDACQSAGYLNISVNNLNVDLLSLNSSKIYGPKGIGALYVGDGINLEPLVRGGGQERGLVGGTENVPGIVGFAKALELVNKNKDAEKKRLSKLQEYFFEKLIKIKGVAINGSLENRLPNNINITIDRVEGESALLYLDAKGICCSTASACSASDHLPSHVILAIGRSSQEAQSSLRFTMGHATTKKDIDYTVKALKDTTEKLRKISAI